MQRRALDANSQIGYLGIAGCGFRSPPGRVGVTTGWTGVTGWVNIGNWGRQLFDLPAQSIEDEYNWKEVLTVQNFKGKYRPNRSCLQNTELPSYGPSICAWMERNESWGCSQQTGRGRSGLLGRTPRSGVVRGAVQRNTRTALLCTWVVVCKSFFRVISSNIVPSRKMFRQLRGAHWLAIWVNGVVWNLKGYQKENIWPFLL